MLETLIELGIFVSEKEVLSQKEIFEKGSITETQKNTVARWLEILKKEGILREEDGRLSRTGKEVAVPEKAGDTETYFNKLKPYLKHMVTGNEVPLDVFYQKEPALAPNMLLRRIPGCEETVERLVQGLRLLAEERRKELYKAQKKSMTVVKGKKIGRNDPCPCGSGKKYKQCCGR